MKRNVVIFFKNELIFVRRFECTAVFFGTFRSSHVLSYFREYRDIFFLFFCCTENHQNYKLHICVKTPVFPTFEGLQSF